MFQHSSIPCSFVAYTCTRDDLCQKKIRNYLHQTIIREAKFFRISTEHIHKHMYMYMHVTHKIIVLVFFGFSILNYKFTQICHCIYFDLPQSAELVKFECWFEHGLIEGFVHLDQQGSHDQRRIELTHLKKQGD